MSALAALLAGIITGVCALTPATAVNLESDEVRVRDVVDLECVEPARRGAVGALIISARRPGEARELTLQREAVAALARRRAPLIGQLHVSGETPILFRFQASSTQTAAPPTCRAAARALAAGDTLTNSDLVAGSCPPPDVRPALHYDRRHGLVRATRPIPEGEALGAVAAMPDAVAEPGDRLALLVQLGPVTIEREVRAAQPARSGAAIFVRDREGHVFSAPFPRAVAEPRP
jgi:hypothetical protein